MSQIAKGESGPRSDNAASDILADAYARHRTELMNFARTLLGNESDAADAVQDCFLRLSRVGDGDIRDPRAFLFTITANIARDRLRRNSRWATTSDPVDNDYLTGTGNPQDLALAREELDVVRTVVGSLPPQCAAVFRLRKLEGFAVKEIARELSISPKTVENHLTKALRILRERMRHH